MTGMEGVGLAAVAIVALVGIVGFALSRGGDKPITGRADMTQADAEARVRSSGIDHLNPGS